MHVVGRSSFSRVPIVGFLKKAGASQVLPRHLSISKNISTTCSESPPRSKKLAAASVTGLSRTRVQMRNSV